MKCRKLLNILLLGLLLFSFSVQVLSQDVLIPIERLESWSQRIQNYENRLASTQANLNLANRKESDLLGELGILNQRLSKLSISAQKLRQDSENYMENEAILDREFRKLETDLMDLIQRFDHILKGQKIRDAIIIGEAGIIIGLVLILIFGGK